MSEASDLRFFHRWHGKKRSPVRGVLDVEWPEQIFPKGKLKEIIYRSTKWQDYPDPRVVKLLRASGVRNAKGPVQGFHHTFSSLFSPTFYDPEPENKNHVGVKTRPLPEGLVCLGTCKEFRISGLAPTKKTCSWPDSVLPLMLGAESLGNTIVLYIPSKSQIGFIQGGVFYISPRGIVW